VEQRRLEGHGGAATSVAFDPGGLEDHQFAGGDRTAYRARQARAFGADRADDFARLALDQRGAGNVAFDAAIDVQVSRGRDIALDGDVGAEHREGSSTHRIPSGPGCL
jgi:hypothetical protein